jgi:hypothetical protein
VLVAQEVVATVDRNMAVVRVQNVIRVVRVGQSRATDGRDRHLVVVAKPR